MINPFLPLNNSPVFSNPPIDNGCVGQCFYHNPGAFDMDGDSLYYSLVPCYGNGKPIPSYEFPPGVTAESIDHLTGQFTWCSPISVCQFDIAILVEEWKYLDGKRYFTGSVLRDVQIDIGTCQNHAPEMKKNSDAFVEVGNNFFYEVSATDPDPNKLTLKATGGPFLLTPAAVFTSTDAVSKVIGEMNWKPDCSQIRLLPYQVTFKVVDNHLTEQLINFEVLNVRVIAPAVQVTAEPFAKTMRLSWTEAICKDTTGVVGVAGYDIYRKMSCDNWVHQPGETGIPVSAGYTKIGSTNATTTKFIDTNNGLWLATGKEYTYIIVVHYKNGALSYASNGACALITSIHEMDKDIAVTIAPNPNKGTFTLISEFYANSKAIVSIKNGLGQIVYRADVFMTKEGQTFDVKLKPGVYIIQVSNEKAMTEKKVVVDQ